MAETAFGVTYDGPALSEGRMPVRDLAPALLALGELFTEASMIVYPDHKPVALSIKATEEGSFAVHLILEGTAWEQIIDIFSSDGASALVNLKELIVGSGVGLFALMKFLRGRRIKRHELTEGGQVRITLDDESTIEVPADTLTLYRTITVRKKVSQVVSPLYSDGISRLDFQDNSEVTVSVDASDAGTFGPPVDGGDVLLEDEQTMVVAIASVAFTEGNKWRLTDGEQTFHAAIEDDAFLMRVEEGVEAFRKGDMLRCRIRFVQTQVDGKLHSERSVIEVLHHIPRETQMRLDS